MTQIGEQAELRRINGRAEAVELAQRDGLVDAVIVAAAAYKQIIFLGGIKQKPDFFFGIATVITFQSLNTHFQKVGEFFLKAFRRKTLLPLTA